MLARQAYASTGKLQLGLVLGNNPLQGCRLHMHVKHFLIPFVYMNIKLEMQKNYNLFNYLCNYSILTLVYLLNKTSHGKETADEDLF